MRALAGEALARVLAEGDRLRDAAAARRFAMELCPTCHSKREASSVACDCGFEFEAPGADATDLLHTGRPHTGRPHTGWLVLAFVLALPAMFLSLIAGVSFSDSWLLGNDTAGGVGWSLLVTVYAVWCVTLIRAFWARYTFACATLVFVLLACVLTIGGFASSGGGGHYPFG